MCPRWMITIMALAASLVAAQPAAAQAPPPAIEIAAGVLFFPEVAEPFVGGAGRFYVSPRISIGPEFAHVSGDGHSHRILTGNVTVDLVREGPLRRVIPFVVGGVGLYQTRERFRDEAFTSTEGTFTAGGGVRVRLNDRVFAGAEARVGWEPHLRVNGLVGIRLGR